MHINPDGSLVTDHKVLVKDNKISIGDHLAVIQEVRDYYDDKLATSKKVVFISCFVSGLVTTAAGIIFGYFVKP